jgi:hypothetical protein
VPIRRSGRHMNARQVMVLMTGAAFNRIQSLPIAPPTDLHRMLMAVVALTRKVSTRVAIHAARMAQHRNDGLKSSRAIVTRYALGLRSGIERQQDCGQEECGASHLHAFRSAALTRSCVKGKSRRRALVASKMALPMAAGVTVIAVSPAPIAATPPGVTKTQSTAGIS